MLIDIKINRKKMLKWLEEFISNVVDFFKLKSSKDLILRITWKAPFVDLIFEIEKDLNEGDDGSWMEDEDAPENTDIIIKCIQQI